MDGQGEACSIFDAAEGHQAPPTFATRAVLEAVAVEELLDPVEGSLKLPAVPPPRPPPATKPVVAGTVPVSEGEGGHCYEGHGARRWRGHDVVASRLPLELPRAPRPREAPQRHGARGWCDLVEVFLGGAKHEAPEVFRDRVPCPGEPSLEESGPGRPAHNNLTPPGRV